MKTTIADWGLIQYGEAWKRQSERFDEVIRAKAHGETYENGDCILRTSARIYVRT